MSEPLLRAWCVHCEGGIEFEAANYQRGIVIVCPHCRKATPLHVELPKKPISKKTWTILGVAAIFAIAFCGAFFDRSDEEETIGMIMGRTMALVFSLVLTLVMLAVAFCIYFIPAYIGRKKRNHMAILVLNLLLGWTGVGWVIALVWALTVEPEK